jgi:hypothetical protein
MSGGHYEYKYHYLDDLADDIERDLVSEKEEYNPFDEYDNETQRVRIKNEVESLLKDLRRCAKRAKELEWYMSGDTGAASYLDRLGKLT